MDLSLRKATPNSSPPKASPEKAPAPTRVSDAAELQADKSIKEGDAPTAAGTAASEVAGVQTGLELPTAKLEKGQEETGFPGSTTHPVVRHPPSPLSAETPSNLPVDEETGFRNVTVQPEEGQVEVPPKGHMEKAIQELEPGREQLGKVVQDKPRRDTVPSSTASTISQGSIRDIPPPRPTTNTRSNEDGGDDQKEAGHPPRRFSAPPAAPDILQGMSVTPQPPTHFGLPDSVWFERDSTTGSADVTGTAASSSVPPRGEVLETPEASDKAVSSKEEISTSAGAEKLLKTGHGHSVIGAEKSLSQLKSTASAAGSVSGSGYVSAGAGEETLAGGASDPVVDRAVVPNNPPKSPFGDLAARSPFPTRFGAGACDLPPIDTAMASAGESKGPTQDPRIGQSIADTLRSYLPKLGGHGSRTQEGMPNHEEPLAGKIKPSSSDHGDDGDATDEMQLSVCGVPMPMLPTSTGANAIIEIPTPICLPPEDVFPTPDVGVRRVTYETGQGVSTVEDWVETMKGMLIELWVLCLAALEGLWPWLIGREDRLLEPLERVQEEWFGQAHRD